MDPGRSSQASFKLLCRHLCGELVAGRIDQSRILEDPAPQQSLCTLHTRFLVNRRIPRPQLGCNLQAECSLPTLYCSVISPNIAKWTGSIKDASEETVFTQASLPLLPTRQGNPQVLTRAFICLPKTLLEDKWKKKKIRSCGTKDLQRSSPT